MQKVVSIRMSVSNNTTINRVERDFIEHTDLNKFLEEGWEIMDSYEAVAESKDGAYTAITFVLEKEA